MRHSFCLLLIVFVCGRACADVAPTIAERIAAAESAFAAKLQALAATAPDDERAILAAWCRPVPLVGERVYVAPNQYLAGEGPMQRDIRWPVASPTTVLRDATLARHEFARELVQLAHDAAAADEASLAMRCAHRAVREDPASADARALVGHERVGDDWLTPYAAKQARAGRTWHAKFGWIRAEDLPRYDRGQRPLGGRWVSGKQDAERHQRIEQGWQVRTDHFVITTNLQADAAVALAAQLEGLHQVWWQLFADVLVDKTALRLLAERGRGLPIPRRAMQVVFHKNEQQYYDRLRARQPLIEQTQGIYFDQFREAHFFASASDTSSTLYHEAVHQLFFETLDSVRSPGSEHNFWAIEAAALPFESLVRDDDPLAGTSFLLGLPDSGRLPAARYRYVASQYRPSLAELVPLGQRDLQSRSDLAALYSQLAGWGHWLVVSGDPHRRRQFAEYLHDIYTGRATLVSFAEHLGSQPPELDAQYGGWITSLPADTPRGEPQG